jgi:hypothetical protein
MVFQILLCQIDFGFFLMVVARGFIPAATFLAMVIYTLGYSSDIDKAV